VGLRAAGLGSVTGEATRTDAGSSLQAKGGSELEAI